MPEGLHGPPGMPDKPTYWCRYCGTRVSSKFSAGGLLCTSHFQWKNKIKENQKQPIDISENQERKILQRMVLKMEKKANLQNNKENNLFGNTFSF